jgi:hypothetical protein
MLHIFDSITKRAILKTTSNDDVSNSICICISGGIRLCIRARQCVLLVQKSVSGLKINQMHSPGKLHKKVMGVIFLPVQGRTVMCEMFLESDGWNGMGGMVKAERKD